MMRHNSLALKEHLYTFACHEQLIVCKRLSSHFVNQPERAGLPQSRQKCFENKDFSGSAGSERPTWAPVIRSQMKQLTMQPSKTAFIRPSDRSHHLFS